MAKHSIHVLFKAGLFLIIFLLGFRSIALAQERPAAHDSTTMYRDIESYSGKSKFTRFFYRLLFKPVTVIAPKKKYKKQRYKKLIQKSYSNFEGKIIRYIGIETLDPFGYFITDTLVADHNFFTKSGNNLHVKSQRAAIRNLLLIKKNQVFDSLLVKESERLVRSQRYVRDVLFYVVMAENSNDSVDIFIRELDKWSLIPKGSFSNSHVKVQLNDINFLGFGHEFKNSYKWYHAAGDDAYDGSYFVPNIRNTYVNSRVTFGNDRYGNVNGSVAVDRPFFSPLTKWAGGIRFEKSYYSDSLMFNDTVNVAQDFKFISRDYWVGQAFQIFKGRSENFRTTKFIYTLRYFNLNFLTKPSATLDPRHIYEDEQMYLTSLGVATRKYVLDKYVYSFGVTEDIPIGRVVSVTGGYRTRRNSGQVYLASRLAFGNYAPWGYLGANFEYGTYFKAGTTQEGMFTTGINYFTGLLQIGKWRIRQFIKPELTIGINRPVIDSITINDGYGIDGFNSTGLTGTNRLVFSFQTQSYAPWSVIGFRFGPYLNYSIGMLGDAGSGFSRSRIYSQIGLGVLIRNENLVIESFELSISFFPIIPGNGYNIFKVNSFKSTDFGSGFDDFQIGKPGTLIYQ